MVARTAREQLRRATGPAATPLLITEGIEVTEDAVWSWVEVPLASTYLSEDDELSAQTLSLAASLRAVLRPGAQFHIKVMWAEFSAQDYRDSWDRIPGGRAPRAGDYIELGAHRITVGTKSGDFRRRVVLLGLQWPSSTPRSERPRFWQMASRQMTSPAAIERDARRRLETIKVDVGDWFETCRRKLGASPASAGLIAWAYARELRRGHALTPPAADVVGTPMMATLAAGEVDPTVDPNYVVVRDFQASDPKHQQTYVSVLVPAALTGFPATDLEIPGGEWLQKIIELPDVEVSVRGESHGKRGSLDLISDAQRLVRSQIAESAITEGPPPTSLIEAADSLSDRSSQVRKDHDYLTTTHARWIITASNPDELRKKVLRTIEAYAGTVQLHRIAGIQDLLWRELLPGDQVRVHEFGHDQPMVTLAGSWFIGGSSFGDDGGPYVGWNLGSSTAPVRLHVASRLQEDRGQPTTWTMTGISGGGKTTAAMMLTLTVLAEGGWAAFDDNKGDCPGICDVAEQVLGVSVQRVHVTDPSSSGMLDPLRFALNADQARSLTLDAVIGVLSVRERDQYEALIELVVDRVLDLPREQWSTQELIRQLCEAPDDGIGSFPAADARDMGNRLLIRARSAELRPVMGPLAPNAQPIKTGRGLVYLSLAGFPLPRKDGDPAMWSVSERSAMVTFRTVMAHLLAESGRVRERKKLVVLTELHLLTKLVEGRAFVEWIARTGRALQTSLLLDSQSATDIAALDGVMEQAVASFAFQAEGDTEQKAQAAILGRPDPGPRLRTMLANLQRGQCVGRDRRGRLTVMQWDRMTRWIADTLDTNAGDEDPDDDGENPPAVRLTKDDALATAP